MKQGFFDYGSFVEKFNPNKTTDDCYTPENIYDVVVRYVRSRYAEGEIVRPFYPGGNFEAAEYPEGCMVVDNPPFSIVSRICRWYNENGIRFFLFCPGLVMSVLNNGATTLICASAEITYENGAEVKTNFLTNMEPGTIARTDPELHNALYEANKENLKKVKVHHPKLSFPDAVLTTAKMNWMAEHNTFFTVKREDAVIIHKLDNYGDVFGYALFLSSSAATERAAAERAAAERAAAERAAAERAAAERAATEQITLSEREKKIQEMLGK